MCGLIFCQDPELLPVLLALNTGRAGRNKGAFTRTAVVNTPTGWEVVDNGYDVFDAPNAGWVGPAVYHLQAPTSAHSRPHPAAIAKGLHSILVWHNGIIKPAAITSLQEELEVETGWDTELLAHAIARQGPKGLDGIDGAFALIVHSSGSLWAIRNAMAPLFTDGVNISSAPAPGFEPMESGMLYAIRAQVRPDHRVLTASSDEYGGVTK